jgi:hypothetical protein
VVGTFKLDMSGDANATRPGGRTALALR